MVESSFADKSESPGRLSAYHARVCEYLIAFDTLKHELDTQPSRTLEEKDLNNWRSLQDFTSETEKPVPANRTVDRGSISRWTRGLEDEEQRLYNLYLRLTSKEETSANKKYHVTRIPPELARIHKEVLRRQRSSSAEGSDKRFSTPNRSGTYSLGHPEHLSRRAGLIYFGTRRE
ncbi:hypothetical protein MNV49_000037 [Pseudohyphozyma bogoriensis]|nr:hypothetical protein MNV49_000037 [Pseudohyphozyma bogoriensis]